MSAVAACPSNTDIRGFMRINAWASDLGATVSIAPLSTCTFIFIQPCDTSWTFLKQC
jgi:hypothetical protein